MPKHRVKLVKFVYAFGDFVAGNSKFASQCVLRSVIVRQELMERRIEKPYRCRQPIQRAKYGDEIVPLVREQLSQGFLPVLSIARQNHFSHGIDPVAFKKHVLSATETDALGAKTDGVLDLLGRVSVRANIELATFVRPLHQRRIISVALTFLWLESLADEDLDDLGRCSRDLPGEHHARRAINGDEIAFLERMAVGRDRLVCVVDAQVAGAANADLPHLAGDEGSV
jgi:hypothetical protein